MMTAVEFREAMKRLDMPQKKFAELTGYREESISRYARGRMRVPQPLEVIVGYMLEKADAPNGQF